MNRTLQVILLGGVVLGLLTGGHGLKVYAAECAYSSYPTLRIPKMLKAPVIDGVIGEEEWKGAAAVTGFKNCSPSHSLPSSLQPCWYIGYDDQYLYLAQRMPIYPKGSLRAVMKTAEDADFGQIWFDDHTEIRIVTVGRDRALSGDGYFFNFMTNPWDKVADWKVRWSLANMGKEYHADVVLKSHFNEETWEQEIAIPFKDLDNIKIEDEKSLPIQLVSARSGENNYYGWGPGNWIQAMVSPEVIFDSRALAVQFLSLGDWMNGNPDLTFNIYNPDKATRVLDINVVILNPKGEQLFAQTKTVPVKSGETIKEHVAAQGLKFGEKENLLKLTITEPASGKLYYRAQLPFQREDSEVVQNYIKLMAIRWRPVEPKISFAFMPSYNCLQARADMGLLGLDTNLVARARYFRAEFGKPGEKPIGINSKPFDKSGIAEIVFQFWPLPEGQYEVHLAIADANGKPLLSKNETFEWKMFPFYTNTLGKTDKVLPPYQPIKTEGQTFKVLSGEYRLQTNGLPAQIVNRMVPVPEAQELLAAGMSLRLVQGEKISDLVGTSFQWESRADNKTVANAKGQLGPLGVEVRGEADYDGQYLVTVKLVPGNKTPIDRLELIMPVRAPVDVITLMQPPEAFINVYNLKTPYRESFKGIAWSTSSRWDPQSDSFFLGDAGRAETRPAGRFQPYCIYLGNGERGLHWYIDSYEGWHIDKNNEYVQIEKRKDQTILRVQFVNKPFVLEEERCIRFALLSAPTKPLPRDARDIAWGYDGDYTATRAHCSGSQWGTIGIWTTPETDQEWQDLLAGKPHVYKGKEVVISFHTAPFSRPMGHKKDSKFNLEKGREYLTYHYTGAIGYLQPEFKVFAGEWIGRNNYPMCPESFYAGRCGWTEPEQLSGSVMDMTTPSAWDFEIYRLWLMAKNTGVGGYWWDMNPVVPGKSLIKGNAYLNDEGNLEPRISLFLAREYFRRIAWMIRDLGIPDTNDGYAPGAVWQIPWFTRIDNGEAMYLESTSDDMFTAHGVDKYRAFIGKYSGLPVMIIVNIRQASDPRVRGVEALALLHDNGIAHYNPKFMAQLKKSVYFDPATEWVPYWRSGKVAYPRDNRLLLTVYRKTAKDGLKLLLVVVNPTAQDIQSNIIVADVKHRNIQAVDLETGTSMEAKQGELKKMCVKKHDYRLIEMELMTE